ncbi:HAD superfamily hydrolase [Alteromonas sp. KC3]|uniref:HAD family hydrolase n=1 Tax=unclassified Alteromonas TaxID=2614992 RepID=UPI001924D023|nr:MULTISPECIES: HAD family hydrolase [unclassified Alteromonas]BCO18151.1 HAD superfamily hydrolase [Alteromonas sp. KC3]BCO22112.1 HAD superfamily hydrolase [Alteromonas sp. KC14]
MIYIFDLDDTLYNERHYVESGLRAVASYVESTWGVNKEIGTKELTTLLDKNGRGRIFNDYLAMHNIADTKSNVKACVSAYRLHKPSLTMPSAHLSLLNALPSPLYLVTDGNKVVQNNKVDALNIAPLFRRVFITHRFGVKHAKPSLYCFEKIKKAEKCEWRDMVYIGDNPSKDFVNLNKVGMPTIRVLTGVHKHVVAKPGYDAAHTINHLNELTSIKL